MRWNVLVVVQRARLGLALFATLSITLLCASPAKAGTTIMQSTCPIVIAQSGEYSLDTDVGPCLPGVDGIDITASNVTLHLNGHNIIGSSSPTACNISNGIHVGLPVPTPMLSQVHVLGTGTISNFSTGFRAQNSAGSFVKFVTVNGACTNIISIGFALRPPGGQWKLQGNVVREPGATSTGIFVFGIDDNDLVENDVNDTIEFGMSNNNTVVNNTANDNQGGISLGVTAFGYTSSNNEVHANTTSNNESSSGLSAAVGSLANNISGNKSFNNKPWDMEDDNINCGTNKWEGNHFGMANEPCIQ